MRKHRSWSLLMALLVGVCAACTGCGRTSGPAPPVEQSSAPAPVKAAGPKARSDEFKEVSCAEMKPPAKPSAFAEVDCPATCDGKAEHRQFNVDAWYHGAEHPDPDVCVRVNGSQPGNEPPDMVTWFSNNPKLTFSVVRFNEGFAGAGQVANLFDCGAKPCTAFTSPSRPEAVVSPPLKPSLKPASGKCYVFRATIKVTENKVTKCYDPHIYTSCSSCLK